MDSLGILDLVIGLFFIYFVFSVICTSIVEGLSQLLRWRSETLEKWLIDLFNNESSKTNGSNGKPASDGDKKNEGSSPKAGDSIDKSGNDNENLGTQLASHDLIRGLTRRKRKPDYIPAHIFSSALFSLLSNGNKQPYDALKLKKAINDSPLNQGLKDYLLHALEESQGSITLVRKRLETWFDHSMEGLIEFYKKQTRIWTFFIALAIAGFANVDTIVLAKYLYENPAQAAILAAVAEKEVADSTLYKKVLTSLETIEKNVQGNNAPDSAISVVKQTKESIQQAQKQYHDLNATLKATGLPLGWKGVSICDDENNCLAFLWKLLGILLTAFALTLGAPFWFDMINKLVNIRSAGNKPAASTTNDHQNPAG